MPLKSEKCRESYHYFITEVHINHSIYSSSNSHSTRARNGAILKSVEIYRCVSLSDWSNALMNQPIEKRQNSTVRVREEQQTIGSEIFVDLHTSRRYLTLLLEIAFFLSCCISIKVHYYANDLCVCARARLSIYVRVFRTHSKIKCSRESFIFMDNCKAWSNNIIWDRPQRPLNAIKDHSMSF